MHDGRDRHQQGHRTEISYIIGFPHLEVSHSENKPGEQRPKYLSLSLFERIRHTVKAVDT